MIKEQSRARRKVIKAAPRFSARREREKSELDWRLHAAARQVPLEQLRAIITAVKENSEAPFLQKLPAGWAIRALAMFRELKNTVPATAVIVPFKAKM